MGSVWMWVCLLLRSLYVCVFLCKFSGFDSWRIWFVLVAVSLQSMHVCVHAQECVLMIEGGYYLASSTPQGEMTAGYAHVGGGGSVDVPVHCSWADRMSLHSLYPTPYLTPTLTPTAHSNWAPAITNRYCWKPLIQIYFTDGASQLPAPANTASTEGQSVSAFS